MAEDGLSIRWFNCEEDLLNATKRNQFLIDGELICVLIFPDMFFAVRLVSDSSA